MPAVLDTHAALWYLLDSSKLSAATYSLVDDAAANGTPTYISAVSLVEVVYLVERGRIVANAFEKLLTELNRVNPT
jgi:PIN domain nuclease of toxin-antitoxin system